MTKPEIIDWLEDLATTPEKRLKIIQNLLHHAGKDHMTHEDRVTCVHAVEMIKAGDGGRTFAAPARDYRLIVFPEPYAMLDEEPEPVSLDEPEDWSEHATD